MYAKFLLIPILLVGTCTGQNINDLISMIFNTSAGIPFASNPEPVTPTRLPQPILTVTDGPKTLPPEHDMNDLISSIFNTSAGIPFASNPEPVIPTRLPQPILTVTDGPKTLPPEHDMNDLISSIFNTSAGIPFASNPESVIPTRLPQPTLTVTDRLETLPPEHDMNDLISSIFNTSAGIPFASNPEPVIPTRLPQPILTVTDGPKTLPPEHDMNDLISSIFNTSAGIPFASNPESVIPTRLPQPTLTVTDRLETLTPTSDNVGFHSYKTCGIGKECVREYLCLNGKINKNGDMLIDMRGAFDTSKSLNGRGATLDDDYVDNDMQCPFLETCCSIDDEVEEAVDDTLPSCGFGNINGIRFNIEGVGENQAEFGEFPWMVGILREEIVMHKVLYICNCGGSLITPKVVLTAAHCVQGTPANTIIVRAGEWDVSNKNELYPHQERKVVEIIIHEFFKGHGLRNDIALLFLESPFKLVPNVNTVCLPPADLSFDLARCYVTGWGKDQHKNGNYQNILKKIDVPIVPNAQCQANLRKTRLGRYYRLHPSLLCAGGEGGKDACKGDGGSPLVCPMKNAPNRFFQAGIVAGGVGCGQENVPGLYASVPKLRAWIDEQLESKQIKSTYFTP